MLPLETVALRVSDSQNSSASSPWCTRQTVCAGPSGPPIATAELLNQRPLGASAGSLFSSGRCRSPHDPSSPASCSATATEPLSSFCSEMRTS